MNYFFWREKLTSCPSSSGLRPRRRPRRPRPRPQRLLVAPDHAHLVAGPIIRTLSLPSVPVLTRVCSAIQWASASSASALSYACAASARSPAERQHGRRTRHGQRALAPTLRSAGVVRADRPAQPGRSRRRRDGARVHVHGKRRQGQGGRAPGAHAAVFRSPRRRACGAHSQALTTPLLLKERPRRRHCVGRSTGVQGCAAVPVRVPRRQRA